jgi:RHS repeat-associated protein
VARIDLPDGASWRYEYDDRGNPVAEIDPLGAVTRFTYDERGAVLAITDPLGAVWRYEVNAAGLPLTAIDPAGSRTDIARNHQGRITQLRMADGALTAIERDSEGRVVAQIAPDGAVTRYGYDAAGNQSLITDPSGRVTRVEYGPFYRPVARTHPDGARYVFGYDAELRLTTVTGPTGLTWNYSYDGNGRRVAERDFDGREQRYGFDEDGRLIEHTAADGAVTTYTRDAAGRLTELRAGNEASKFGYDRVGRLVRAVNRHAAVSIERDLLGRTVREEINGRAVTRRYDATGNLIERETGSGAVSRWIYDSLGEAASLGIGSDTLSFTHDVLGREVRREFGAFALTQGYDSAGQLAIQQMTTAERVVQERAYGYDPDGLPVRVRDLLRGTRVMDLDPVGRVTAVNYGDHAEQYAYDPVGNLTESQIPGVPADSDAAAALGPHTVSATRTVRAGRTEYTYDERGRLTGKTRRTLSGKKLTWSFTWNAHDRLSSVVRPDGQQWSYRYDALGRRIDKSHIDQSGQTVQAVVFSWDGTLLAEQTTRRPDAAETTLTWDYEPGGYRPAAQRRTERPTPAGQDGGEDQGRIDAEFWAIVTDLTGRPRELVDRNGQLTWADHSTLWGARGDLGVSPTGRIECPLGFPGQYHDAETGLYYNNQRYYDPDTAAYLSPDPAGLDAAPHPQRYVSNPLTAIDPLGLTPQAPTPRTTKTDDELQADADALHETIRTKYGNRAYNGSTVSTFQGEDGKLFYSVNGSKTNNIMRDLAEKMGYQRISGAEVTGDEQTDAEQLMLNGVDKGKVPDTGRIATSRPPCGEFRNNGKPAQNCAARIARYSKIRLVGRYAT